LRLQKTVEASGWLETPEKPLVHFPWIDNIAHRSLQIDRVGPSVARVARKKKIRSLIFVDDMAKEGLGEES
jgi:hypothetical protein